MTQIDEFATTDLIQAIDMTDDELATVEELLDLEQRLAACREVIIEKIRRRLTEPA